MKVTLICPTMGTPELTPQTLRDLASLRAELGAAGGLFVGWQDEGYDQQPEARLRELATLFEGRDRFNRTQGPAVLPRAS